MNKYVCADVKPVKLVLENNQVEQFYICTKYVEKLDITMMSKNEKIALYGEILVIVGIFLAYVIIAKAVKML